MPSRVVDENVRNNRRTGAVETGVAAQALLKKSTT
jgi:hypothetical protein